MSSQRDASAYHDAALAHQVGRRRAALARILADVPNDDECSLLGEAQRDRAPEPGRTAGDDGNTTFEATCVRHVHTLRGCGSSAAWS